MTAPQTTAAHLAHARSTVQIERLAAEVRSALNLLALRLYRELRAYGRALGGSQ